MGLFLIVKEMYPKHCDIRAMRLNSFYTPMSLSKALLLMHILLVIFSLLFKTDQNKLHSLKNIFYYLKTQISFEIIIFLFELFQNLFENTYFLFNGCSYLFGDSSFLFLTINSDKIRFE